MFVDYGGQSCIFGVLLLMFVAGRLPQKLIGVLLDGYYFPLLCIIRGHLPEHVIPYLLGKIDAEVAEGRICIVSGIEGPAQLRDFDIGHCYRIGNKIILQIVIFYHDAVEIIKVKTIIKIRCCHLP